MRVVGILIHTSVKLVTDVFPRVEQRLYILIHTSVKLVTFAHLVPHSMYSDFNPHEREARDLSPLLSLYIR